MDPEVASQSSDGSDYIYNFIFEDSDYSHHVLKSERSEYKIRVETDLKDPVLYFIPYVSNYSWIRKDLT